MQKREKALLRAFSMNVKLQTSRRFVCSSTCDGLAAGAVAPAHAALVLLGVAAQQAVAPHGAALPIHADPPALVIARGPVHHLTHHVRGLYIRARNEGSRRFHGEGPYYRAFSWLKALSHLGHY